MDPQSFRYVCDLTRREAAIVIEPGKEYLVDSRLAPIVIEEGLRSIDALVDRLRLKAEPLLQQKVVEAMTTNETSFFRDLHPFETLRKVVLPSLVAARSTRKTLRIWCAAASTGQEPYSIAMMLKDRCPELASWQVEITATDLNTAVLERARRGVYRQFEINRGLPATMLVKHFRQSGTEWQLSAAIRDMVTFRQLNLLDRWPLSGPFDIVFMRNVLIYFDVPTKRAVLQRVREQMNDDGVLFLGAAETKLDLDEEYVSSQSGTTVYHQARPKSVRSR